MTLREKYHRGIFIFALFLMAASMSLGKFFLGGSLFIISANWIVEGNFKSKYRLFLSRPSIAILMGLFLIHFVGLLWTPDHSAGWNDLKIKLPLFFIPMVIGTSLPLKKKAFEYLLLTFVGAVFISSIVTTLVVYKIYVPIKPILDIRDASIFVPLIRLSLMTALSVFLLLRWTVRIENYFLKFLSLALVFWFNWFLQNMQSLTGLVILYFGGFILLLTMSFIYRKRVFSIVLCSLFAIAGVLGVLTVNRMYTTFFTLHPIDSEQLDTLTLRGHKYDHNFKSAMIENGNPVMTYYCWNELDSAWNSRSKIIFDRGKDTNGNPISITLLRYLASKDWRKDANAIAQLSDKEIAAVERGATNALDSVRSPVERRLYQVCWELYHYSHGANPSGNSVTMRIELAKTAVNIIKQNPWIGVGTGGQQKSFENHYQMSGSSIEKEWQWLHAHNQFLSIGVCLGIPGLIYFIFSIWFVPHSMKRWRSYLYLAFFIVFLLSFLDDDTLETSQGIGFFIFFNVLFLYMMPRGSAFNLDKE